MSLLKLKSKFCKLGPDQRLYALDVPLIGLTGGIATGKSSVSNILNSKSLPIIDADALVKEIYAKESTKTLVASVAPTVSGLNGIDFKALRAIFFKDSKVKSELETHIYGLLPSAFQKAYEDLDSPDFVIYDVPLLFEKGLDKVMDATVLVYAPREQQIERLINRDHIDENLAKTILSNQWPIDKKRDLADLIIDNSNDFKALDEKVESLAQELFL